MPWVLPQGGDGVLDDQLAQFGVRDAELGVAAKFAFAVDQGDVFRMLLELGAVGGDDRVVGMTAVEVKAFCHVVPLTPLAIGHLVVAPQAPVVPNAAGVKGRAFRGIDAD